jgi:cytochrome c nitrite reductase small subunit
VFRFALKRIIAWIFAVVRKGALTFFVGFAFAILCFIGINAAMEPASKSEFCGSKCHEMKTAYQSWELSVHGANKRGISVECIDCHLPSKDEYFKHIATKAYDGAKDVFKHYFIGRYDVEESRKEVLEDMPNERCMQCHNNLLARPSNSDARIAHVAVLSQLDEPENKCIVCHEDAGHNRQSRLFSP